jgi:acyl carrier protein
LELQLSHIWEAVLNIRPISLTDDFFDLGGHSLLAVRLTGQIREQFGRDLPLATLFEASTIAQLADVLRQESDAMPRSTLVTIQPNGSKPPFFCVHAIGGEVLNFIDLARHLGPDQPFYGLQAPSSQDAHDDDTSIEKMAAYYLDVIQEVQPEGPYLLGGLCAGGVIALEMAQQLHQRGGGRRTSRATRHVVAGHHAAIHRRCSTVGRTGPIHGTCQWQAPVASARGAAAARVGRATWLRSGAGEAGRPGTA